MQKRKYTKKSEYWKQFKDEASQPSTNQPVERAEEFLPSRVGGSMETAKASRIGGVTVNNCNGANSSYSLKGQFPYIANAGSPFLESEDGYSIREAILLCQKAYYNIPVFMNAIDVMTEFTNTEYYLEGGTAASRKFFNNWLESINIEGLKEQYFRERYRGGNVFMYRIEGSLDAQGIKTLLKVSPKPVSSIPVKYTLLNPVDIIAARSINFSNASYFKMLSKFEIEKIKHDDSPTGKALYDSLDSEAKRKIANNEYSDDGISVPLSPKNVLMSFYKKQDYEPFAVPFGYRVLDDLNAKMELKKTDQHIMRTVQEVILLITMGESPKSGGAGVNPAAMDAMTLLFEEGGSKGRVLVSDFTTEAEFVIPDIKKVVGPEKYQILNEDIKEGLSNIIAGKENYSSTQVKAEMFLERLKESRNAFVRDFIQPEIDRLAALMGYKKAPQFQFKNIDLKDENITIRLVTRLLELGILTPEQAMETIDSGLFPKPKEIKKGHKEYVEERKDGYANPIVGGVPFVETEEDQAVAGVPTPKKKASNKTQNKTKKSAGRPVGSTAIGSEDVDYETVTINEFSAVVSDLSDLEDFVTSTARDKFNCKRLNKNQKELCKELCFKLIASAPLETCKASAEEVLSNPTKLLSLKPSAEVEDLAELHGVPIASAAMLYQAILKK